MIVSRREMVLAAAAAAGALPARAATTHRINIPADKTAFEPAGITVKAGDTVRWRNRSIVEHSVVCDPAKASDPANSTHPKGAAPFDSGVLAQDAIFEQTFTTSGTYLYVCREHQAMGMRGKIIVQK